MYVIDVEGKTLRKTDGIVVVFVVATGVVNFCFYQISHSIMGGRELSELYLYCSQWWLGITRCRAL